MPNLQMITNVLDIIEEKINKKLTTDTLAKEVSISPSHLQGMFVRMTGIPLMTYVHKRKMARSLNELYNSHMRIIDIAHEYGFSHEQSYERAFLREFDCSPAEARLKKTVLTIQECIALEYSSSATGFICGPDHIFMPTLHMVGKAMIITPFDDPILIQDMKNKAYAQLCAKIPAEFVRSESPLIYCRHLQKNEYEYILCLEVITPFRISSEFRCLSLPAQHCVRFRYIAKHQSIVPFHKEHLFVIAINYFDKQNRYEDMRYYIEKKKLAYEDHANSTHEAFYPVTDNHVAAEKGEKRVLFK